MAETLGIDDDAPGSPLELERGRAQQPRQALLHLTYPRLVALPEGRARNT